MEETQVHAGGRPTNYSQEIADKICEQLAQGISLRTVCLDDDMPSPASVFNWLRIHKEFLEQYQRAKDESTDALYEGLSDLGDNAIDLSQSVDPKSSSAVVNAVKLKADNLKWMMSKMKPKKYGDKIDMTTNGKDLPVPLLHAISNNPSGTEAVQTQEED